MLIEQIKADRIEAKRNNKSRTDLVLTTLISEIQRTQPRPSDIPSDEECIKVMQKYVKNLNEMINITPDNPDFRNELKLISEYLPASLTDDELRSTIEMIIEKVGAETMRDMGKVMKELKTEVTQPYDGGVASKIVRELLG